MQGDGGTHRRPRNRAELIVLAGAELFCARGYHNVGVNDIADAVGITGPAIYRHFRTKQEILAGAILRLSDDAAETVQARTAGQGPPGRKLEEALSGLLDLALNRRGAGRLYQWEGRHLAAADQRELARRATDLVTRLRALLRAERPELSKQDAGMLVRAALSVVASPATHRATLPPAKAHATLRDCARSILAAGELPPPGRKNPPEGSPDVLPRRERLITESVRLFRERGYHQVSMGEIGAAAGINGSSVYKHFTSKAELLAAACYRAAARLEVATADAFTGAESHAQALGQLIDSYVRLTVAQSDLVAVYVAEEANLTPEDKHALRLAQRRHIDIWAELVADTCGGETPAQTRFRVHAALNVIADLAARWPADAGAGPRVATLVRAMLLPQTPGTGRAPLLQSSAGD
ncbi:TetR/AcrR family transcriptional regulator [Amycolatopsis acidicola]|uniref:TetR/AcrR family transcriptional regulator n=1 Tax=Amycolatopsis acidicola TaxID=2596893 RepID=A0A5N0UML0_9PSEU|nr:TetR/AcrR family transcriptional regulator [Amycolatopsis acidicola]KAA9151154.1 TetR/AcrR family transcriptional regulator [Amycolatopsis acidicola]